MIRNTDCRGPRAAKRSAASRRSSQSRSASGNHAALAGRSGSQASTMTPSTMAGSASRMNSHCHPRSPQAPAIWSRIRPEMGEPRKVETGIATMK